jgi:hypothetical protein
MHQHHHHFPLSAHLELDYRRLAGQLALNRLSNSLGLLGGGTRQLQDLIQQED